MKKAWWQFLFLGIVALAACNLPGAATPAISEDAVQTAAAMTVQAALTQAVQTTPTVAPNTALSPTPVANGVVFTVTPAPTFVKSSTPQPTQDKCNVAHFVADVTVPDGTVFKPGETFTKTWRLKNVGTCTWENYTLVFDSGAKMGGPSIQPIPGPVAPGAVVDVSVNLIAPTKEGTYKGFWRLRDDKDVLFGLTTGNAFWVEIKVVKEKPTATPAPTLVPPALLISDFYQDAPNASWYNCSGDALPFPGASGDAQGFARYADAYILEDGNSYDRVLEMHPQWVEHGCIIGQYNTITLPPNAHFRAKVGFIAATNGVCGAGDVYFRFYILKPNVPPLLLQEWHKACDGSLLDVDVDLSAYANQSVRFALQVGAGDSSAQDWAVWVHPVISTP